MVKKMGHKPAKIASNLSAENAVALAKIRNLDCSGIKKSLKKKKGFWWGLRHSVDELEKQYHQFLYLIFTNPKATIVPWSQNLDDFWHEHILDTSKYAADCDKIFGRFIHHNPHLPQGTAAHKEAFKETKKLYAEMHGKRSSSSSGVTYHHTDAGCGVGCSIVPFMVDDVVSNNSSSNCWTAGWSCSSAPDTSSSNNSSSCSSGSSSSCSSGSSCGGSSCGGGGD